MNTRKQWEYVPCTATPYNLTRALANQSSGSRKHCTATIPRKTSMCPPHSLNCIPLVNGRPRTLGLGFKRASQSHKENHVQRPPRQYRETQNQIPPAKSHSVAVLGAARAQLSPRTGSKQSNSGISYHIRKAGKRLKWCLAPTMLWPSIPEVSKQKSVFSFIQRSA